MEKLFTLFCLTLLNSTIFGQEISSESQAKSFSISKTQTCEGESINTFYNIQSALITEGESSYLEYFDLKNEERKFAESSPVLYNINNNEAKKKIEKKLQSLVQQPTQSPQGKPKPVVTINKNEKRVALLIGNNNYTTTAKLKNPVNDVNLMTAVLDSLNFEVHSVTNGDYNSMLDGLKNFSHHAKDADVALFYFAGHGLQFDGKNYLIPVNANIESKETVALETIDIDLVLRILEIVKTKQRLNLVILDACRNNPFGTWSRGGNSGLAPISPTDGTIVAYSTSPNSTASDGTGDNGLYTEELAKQLLIPQRIEDVFIRTRVAVEEKSFGNQSPWELARLRASYSFLIMK